MLARFGKSNRLARVLAMALVIVSGDLAAEMLTAEPAAPLLVAVDSLDAPDVVAAGEGVTVTAEGAMVDGVAEVLVHGGYGTLRFEMAIDGGRGQLLLPPAATQHAGVVTIEVGEHIETFEILPGEVTTLVAPLVGPRTIAANGADETLAVLLPTDRFGNQVADGTNTNIIWEQPGDVDSTASPLTEDGMAWAMIPSGEVAGLTMVRATAGDDAVRANAVRIDEVPGTVRDITLTASTTDALADGRSVVALHTDELTDRFGNTIADGTIAQFVFDGPSGRGAVTGTVQNGAVHMELSAPTEPGRLVGHLDIHGVASNEITVDYRSAIASFEARLEFIGEEAVLRIDNALDPSGAFVADGTQVSWGDQAASLRRGAAEIWLPAPLAPTNATVEILGLAAQTEQVTP